ncbi:MAG: YigZ family protein [Lachnospiraceae bacterium]|nr:YigZ family protein [Lachnospiraceae bacterium]
MYTKVLKEGRGEIVEKKSRFIGYMFEAENEEQVREHLAQEKKKYPDARHYCYAYIFGKNGLNVRAADDGEPQGTAGKPILEVLKGAKATDTCIIVTRIFGGVLLGTGGLTRAYADAAKAALNAGDLKEHTEGKRIKVTVSYGLSEKVKYYLTESDIYIEDTGYAENVDYTLLISADLIDSVLENIKNLTASEAVIEDLGVTDVPV